MLWAALWVTTKWYTKLIKNTTANKLKKAVKSKWDPTPAVGQVQDGSPAKSIKKGSPKRRRTPNSDSEWQSTSNSSRHSSSCSSCWVSSASPLLSRTTTERLRFKSRTLKHSFQCWHWVTWVRQRISAALPKTFKPTSLQEQMALCKLCVLLEESRRWTSSFWPISVCPVTHALAVTQCQSWLIILQLVTRLWIKTWLLLSTPVASVKSSAVSQCNPTSSTKVA